MELKSQFHGWNKNFTNRRKNGIKFDEIKKLTIKIDSSLSNVNK